MPPEIDRIFAELMEQLIESGPEGMASAFTALMNLAMRIERERRLGAQADECTPKRSGCANGDMPRKIDTAAGAPSLQVPKSRGGENANGRIRRWLPGTADLDTVTDADIQARRGRASASSHPSKPSSPRLAKTSISAFIGTLRFARECTGSIRSRAARRESSCSIDEWPDECSA